MGHKAFEIIGERIWIDTGERQKEGIFQESPNFQTTAEGNPRPALDFIEPVYDTNPQIEEFAKGRNPRERINPDNPILSLHQGVDHLLLRYAGKIDGLHIFKGKLAYVRGMFCNDGNFEAYDRYKEPLKWVGFKII